MKGLGAALACGLGLMASGCVVASALRQVPPSAAVRETPDLAYYSGEGYDDAKHRLDVYAPAQAEPHGAPAVVFVHGGGWIFGDRSFGGAYQKLGRRLAAQGVVTAVVSYRLAPRHKHPEAIRDVARAVAWSLRELPRFGADPARVFVMGHSAGAHLAALVACDARWLEEQGASPRQLAGVIGISGPYDIRRFGGSALVAGVPMVIPSFGRDRKVWRDASPASHLEGHPPPFLIAVADGDPGILHRHADAFAQALTRAGVPVTRAESSFKDHFTVIMDLGEPGELTQATLRFLRTHRAP